MQCFQKMPEETNKMNFTLIPSECTKELSIYNTHLFGRMFYSSWVSTFNFQINHIIENMDVIKF